MTARSYLAGDDGYLEMPEWALEQAREEMRCVCGHPAHDFVCEVEPCATRRAPFRCTIQADEDKIWERAERIMEMKGNAWDVDDGGL